MDFKQLKTLILILINLFCFADESTAQNEKEQMEVVLRMVGHQVLLNSGDSVSLVLPIESDGDKFRIRFESELEFMPSEFAASIDSIVQATNLAKSYRVEVENTVSGKIIYSYQVDSSKENIIPCGPRSQPKAKYSLLFTVLEGYNSAGLAKTESPNVSSMKSFLLGLVLVVILVMLVFGFYFWKRRIRNKNNSGLVRIGKYQFDERNMKLLLKKESFDLTSKEVDLIALLHSSVNVTLERDVILKAVWEDEGDYVGRTLDVFISKLRKKFAEDSTVKIVNIRGVGYKLMLDASGTNNS